MAEYIEKKAAIDAIYKRRAWEYWEDILMSLPPADVRPVVRGRWEDCSSGWMCSNCSWTQIRESHYCPNCGADMRGGDAEWESTSSTTPE